ncbi:MAG: hypothetical protein HOV83_19740, partial [Catenulispora sp.]|nr:hypothetical protein [Catenulispora sp.]
MTTTLPRADSTPPALRPVPVRLRTAVELALMLGGVAGWVAVLHHEVGGDGADRAAALTALVRHGELVNNPYSLIGPLFAAPLLAIDDRLLA